VVSLLKIAAFGEEIQHYLNMEYQRSERVGDLLLEVLAELLRRDIHDPRLQWLNLTGAKVSKDLRHAKVFYNLLGAAVDKDEVSAGLKSAAGFLRSRIGKKLNLRFVPAIDFIYDQSEDEARHIDALLDEVKK
jgi:ribosome-binding factor A